MTTNIYIQKLLELEKPDSEIFANDKKKVFVKLTNLPNEQEGNPYGYSWKDLFAYGKDFNFKKYVEEWADKEDGTMNKGADIMRDAAYVLFFIPEKKDQARFVSIYRIDNSIRKENKAFFDLTEIHDFDNLKERVVVLWKGDISTAQHWYRDVKKGVLAERFVLFIDKGVRKDVKKFESYADVMLSYDELCSVIKDKEWQDKLSVVNCIYSIVDKRNGKQYIGQTSNSRGILGRWEVYANTVNGGDEELIKLGDDCVKKNFQWTILETLPLVRENDKEGKDKITEREQFYKRKFCTSTTKSGGYNPN